MQFTFISFTSLVGSCCGHHQQLMVRLKSSGSFFVSRAFQLSSEPRFTFETVECSVWYVVRGAIKCPANGHFNAICNTRNIYLLFMKKKE